MRTNLIFISIVAAVVPTGFLAGCTVNTASNEKSPNRTLAVAIHGEVHGDRAFVSGAHIYLYEAGRGGFGANATSLIRSNGDTFEDGNGTYYVLAGSNGMFAVNGEATCGPGQEVYMVATGNGSGLPEDAGPSTRILGASLGPCPATGTLAARAQNLVIDGATTAALGEATTMAFADATAAAVSQNAPVASPVGAHAPIRWLQNAVVGGVQFRTSDFNTRKAMKTNGGLESGNPRNSWNP